jgi:hypothetical protein
VDPSLCDECQGLPADRQAACIDACPTEAITLLSEAVPVVTEAVRPVTPRPRPSTIEIETRQESVPLRAQVLPVLGTMASWAAREILPRLGDSLLRSLDRWAAERQTGSISSRSTVRKERAPGKEEGAGRRRRRRRGR